MKDLIISELPIIKDSMVKAKWGVFTGNNYRGCPR